MNKTTLIIILTLVSFGISSQNLQDLSFGTDNTLEVISWNIEWFPKNGQVTVDSVKQIIEALDVDVLALQEISDTVLFRQMVNELDGYSTNFESAWFAGLAYIYKTNAIEISSIYEIYTTFPFWNAFPRSPLVMEMTFMNEEFIIINNHFKCCGDGLLNLSDEYDEESRRLEATILLKQYIDEYFPNDRVIVLGDLNDELTDDEYHNVFQPFIDSPDSYYFVDTDIAEESSLNWSYPSWPSHLDHIMISNEIFSDFENDNTVIETIKIDDYLTGGFPSYDYNISDHRPVGLKFTPTPIEVGIDESAQIETVYSLYPNPSNGLTFIRFEKIIGNACIDVFSSQGSLVKRMEIEVGHSAFSFQTNDLENGLYSIKIYSDSLLIGSSRLVVLH